MTLEIARGTVARLNQAHVNNPAPDLDWFDAPNHRPRGRRPPGSRGPKGVSFDERSPTVAASSIDYVGSPKAC
jgi:hypothetical protein